VPLVVTALREANARRVAVAGVERMPVPAWAALSDVVELVDVGERLAALRRRKSPGEIELLRAAARVTDRMLDRARELARPGVTENEVAAELTAVALAAGAALAFEPSVIAGVDEPIPIRRTTDRRLREGDTVMVDLGAEVGGYQADASRTFVIGAPTEQQRRAWDVVRQAYDAAVALTRPGVACRELHASAAAVLEGAGFAIEHRVGHGIGLATSYEWPSLDTEAAPLEPGMTICIEPGAYAPGIGNMKLEDDFVITPDGHERLTRSDAALAVHL
jgi:Xaa-Pro aminopeptidase